METILRGYDINPIDGCCDLEFFREKMLGSSWGYIYTCFMRCFANQKPNRDELDIG